MPDSAYISSTEPSSKDDAVRQILHVWRANIGLFFACTITVLVVGGGAVELLKPTYTATATVAIPPDCRPSGADRAGGHQSGRG